MSLAALLLAGCATREITARRYLVQRVIDGDTFVIMYDGELTSCRIYGIDAPERGQPGFLEAKTALEDEILGRTIKISFPGRRKRDNFGRLLVSYER